MPNETKSQVKVTYDVFRPYYNSGPKLINLDYVKTPSFKQTLLELTEHGKDLMKILEHEPNDAHTRLVFYMAMSDKTEKLFEERKISSQKVVCDKTNNLEGSSLKAAVHLAESIGVDYYGIEFSYV